MEILDNVLRCLISQDITQKSTTLMHRKLSARKKEMVRNLAIKADWVLDAGCGNGYYTQEILTKVENIVGVDLSIESLRSYKHRIGKKASVIKAALENLPFRHSSFDQCLLLDSLEHSKDPTSVLKQIHDSLHQNGQLIATMPNWYNLLLDREKLHTHFHSSVGWKKVLEQSRFKVIFMTCMGFPILDSAVLTNHLHVFGFWLLFVARALL